MAQVVNLPEHPLTLVSSLLRCQHREKRAEYEVERAQYYLLMHIYAFALVALHTYQ